MKSIALACYFISSVLLLSAQTAVIEWQRTLGGTANDELRIIINTNDGGFIAGGGSASGISTTKSEATYGDYDYWVVKFDGAGNVAWENTIGGSGSDILNVIRETADNGFILGGTSFSGLSGEKTEAGIGSADYWIVKLDNNGNIEWQNTIGGTGADDLLALDITDDGGFLLGGHSSSPVSGDKTLPTYGPSGNTDYWILKLDAAGTIEWQKVYGGNNVDVCYAAAQTSDGGYILGGHSLSGANGIKTDTNVGLYDYWVIKTNAAGNIEWQNGLGGNGYDLSRTLIETSDGGFLVGGYSGSGATGDKNEPLIGIYDYWVIKLSATGNIEWQNTIGGTSDEYLFSLKETSDGHFLLGGYSYSGIGGDKIETTEGSADFWIVKLDALGSIASQEVIGAEDNEYLYSIGQAPDGGYIIGGQSGSGISGDKTEDNVGGWDFWVVKLESTCIPATETCNALDDDCDGLVDEGIMESISIIANDTTTFCKGGKVTLTASYTGTSLQWQKNSVDIAGATGATYSATVKGTYTCITTSLCGMATSNTIEVTVNKKPTAEITAGGPTTFCEGGSVVLTANSGSGLSYQWFKGSTLLAGETSINYTATIAGNFKCNVTKNSSGCNKNSNIITVSVPCRTYDKTSGDVVQVFPNPANEFITFDFSHVTVEQAKLSIYDAGGRLIKTFDITADQLIITAEETCGYGMYFYSLKTTDQPEIRGKFIIQR